MEEGKNQLNQIHKFIKKEDINKKRINAFNAINKKENNIEKYIDELVGRDIINILGPDVMIQKKINLSIQMPDDDTSILDLHSDCWSGDSPYQINLWLPLTNAESTNSMFVFNIKKTNDVIQKIYANLHSDPYDTNKEIEQKDFIKIKYGEFIIFNPGLLHGNVINKTKNTRISINIRFKSKFSPEPSKDHITRSSGIYYKDYKKSEWTELANKISKIN